MTLYDVHLPYSTEELKDQGIVNPTKDNVHFYDVPKDHPSGSGCLIIVSGHQYWKNSSIGYFHRGDGPAAVYTDGSNMYLHHGVNHRYDGPACLIKSIYSYNDKVRTINPKTDTIEWWIKGNKINGEDYLKWLDEMELDMYNLSDEDKLMIDLRWSI